MIDEFVDGEVQTILEANNIEYDFYIIDEIIKRLELNGIEDIIESEVIETANDIMKGL